MESRVCDQLLHNHEESDWMRCTLCRSTEQSRLVLQRAQQRKVDWPEVRTYSAQQTTLKDPDEYTNIDDAFASILQFMSATSKNCKRYYGSCTPQESQSPRDAASDQHHCSRFHTAKYSRAQRRNPLQSCEDVHLKVQPGMYSVTAGEWGSSHQQTHVVKVGQDQTVNLDFVL